MVRENRKSESNKLTMNRVIFIRDNYFLYIVFMLNNSEKAKNQQFDKRILKIIDPKTTQLRLKTRLKIIQKVIHSLAWINKDKFTDDLFYEIDKFTFRNPLFFVVPIYKHVDNRKLRLHEKKSYILVNASFQRNQEKIRQKQALQKNNYMEKAKPHYQSFNTSQKVHNGSLLNTKLDCLKQGQYAIGIKVHRCWKSCKLNYSCSTLRQIITKSKHLLDFLKNIKIDNPKQPIQQNQTYSDNDNFEQKEGKLYTLVCQNYDYIFSKIAQIQQNQKQKRMDDSIAKTYVQMMNKNMIILSVQKSNYNPISYKSEGKFLYVENTLKLPLVSQRFQRLYGQLQSFKIQTSLLQLIPYLECNSRGQWGMKNKIHGSLQLFQQNGKQLDRGHGLIIDRFLTCFQYDDFSIREV